MNKRKLSSNQVFLEAKVSELLTAGRKTSFEFVTESEMAQYTTLNNYVKECYVYVGILKEGPKHGKSKTYAINIGKCNTETVQQAYKHKECIRHKNKDANALTETLNKTAKQLGHNIVATTKKTAQSKKEELFPSIEDCKVYLKHHYGVHYEVIFMEEGFELDTYSCKKK